MSDLIRHQQLAQKYWNDPAKWRWRSKSGDTYSAWTHLTSHPSFSVNHEYEIEPWVQMVELTSPVSFPRPEISVLECNTTVFIVDSRGIFSEIWNGNAQQLAILRDGKIHLSSSAAWQHATAIANLTYRHKE